MFPFLFGVGVALLLVSAGKSGKKRAEEAAAKVREELSPERVAARAAQGAVNALFDQMAARR